MSSHKHVIVAALAALAAVVPASAWADRATRATFLRAGPGLHYAVTDEVDNEANLDVLRCADAWCEVRFEGAVGWVQAATVTTQAAPAPAPTQQSKETQPCFEDRQAGYGKGERTRFCPR